MPLPDFLMSRKKKGEQGNVSEWVICPDSHIHHTGCILGIVKKKLIQPNNTVIRATSQEVFGHQSCRITSQGVHIPAPAHLNFYFCLATFNVMLSAKTKDTGRARRWCFLKLSLIYRVSCWTPGGQWNQPTTTSQSMPPGLMICDWSAYQTTTLSCMDKLQCCKSLHSDMSQAKRIRRQ